MTNDKLSGELRLTDLLLCGKQPLRRNTTSKADAAETDIRFPPTQMDQSPITDYRSVGLPRAVR
jgi:hypothetical protein